CERCTSALIVWPASANDSDVITLDQVEATCAASGEIIGLRWCWIDGLSAGTAHTAGISRRSVYGSGPPTTVDFVLR
ncbi:MAG: hypothetical protein ACKOJC_00770, partial [Actinomycetota bacterium]